MKTKDITSMRETLGLNQAELAQLLGVHPMTVSKWERGAARPTAYQQMLLERFSVTAGRKAKQAEELKTLLIGTGIVAALVWLLGNGKGR